MHRSVLGLLGGALLVCPGAWAAPAVNAPANRGAALGGGRAVGPRNVAVIREPAPDATCQEIATRIVAELSSNGTPVMLLTCAASTRSCLADAGLEPSAVMAVQCRGGVRAVEVRTEEALPSGTRKIDAAEGTQVQRLAESDAPGGPASLAIRSTELVKAMWNEPVASAAPPPSVVPIPAAPPAVSAEAAAPGSLVSRALPARASRQNDVVLAPASAWRGPAQVPRGPRNLTVNVGAAMIGGFKGLRSAFGPSLGLGRRMSSYLLVSGILAGPAFGAEQQFALESQIGESVVGTASLRHEMALLQADLLGLLGRRLVVRAGVAGGVYHVRVDGQVGTFDRSGVFSMRQGSGGGYAALGSLVAGMVVNLRSDVGIFVEGRVIVLGPTPVILLNGTEVGRSGNPAASLAAGLELRL